MLGTSRVIAAVLASSLLVGTVLAQPTKPPTDKEKQVFGDLMKQAIAKSQSKDHLAAIEIYLKAYAVWSNHSVLSNIGTEYQLASKPVEALKFFCMYLEKDPAGALVTYATSQARVLQIQLGNTVDDNSVCKPPEPIVPPGTGSGSGSATTGSPGDGSGSAVTGTEPFTPPPAEDPGGTLKLGGLIAGGVGVVTLGFGFYFGLQAKNINDDVEDQGENEMWRNDIRAYMEKGQRYEYMQIGFLVGGGALLIGGVAAYMVGRGKTAESLTVTPSVTPGGGGVSFSGRF